MSDEQTVVTEVETPLADQPEVVEVVEAAPAVVEDQIQIGDQTFTSQEEAIAYATQLQSQVGQDNAYQQGINDTLMTQQNQQSVTPAPAEPAFDEAAFYENPAKVLQEIQAKAVATATETIRKEQARTQKTNEIWNDFYIKYPKLKASKDVVKATLDADWGVLGNMADGKKALDIVAQRATQKVQEMFSAFNPGVPLERTNSGASPGNQKNVTTPTLEEPKLAFSDQLSQHYKL